jgi:hypothetical protein
MHVGCDDFPPSLPPLHPLPFELVRDPLPMLPRSLVAFKFWLANQDISVSLTRWDTNCKSFLSTYSPEKESMLPSLAVFRGADWSLATKNPFAPCKLWGVVKAFLNPA